MMMPQMAMLHQNNPYMLMAQPQLMMQQIPGQQVSQQHATQLAQIQATNVQFAMASNGMLLYRTPFTQDPNKLQIPQNFQAHPQMLLMQQNPALFAVPQPNFPAQLWKSPKGPEPTGQTKQLEVQPSPSSIGSSGLKGSISGTQQHLCPPTPVTTSEAGDVRDKTERREEDESKREGEIACRSSESEDGSENDPPEERKDNKLMRSMLRTVGRGEYCILAKDELGNPLAPFEYNGTDVKRMDPLSLNPEDGQGDGKNPQKASAITLKLYQMATELCPKIEGPQEPAFGRFVLYQPAYNSCARHIKNGINRDLLSYWWKTILLHCPWLNPSITDRTVPRLVCWLTSKGCMCTYTYSGAASSPVLMPDWLEEIGKVVMQILG